jgi:lipopolysaccharide/colanic/teichoic acid biosynthesis glycosyltransferase
LSNANTKSGLYKSGGKRLLDFCSSAIGLLVLAPVLVLIALVIKILSPGPLFYRQERVGKGGHTFKIMKFRTMQVDADKLGPSITAGGDPRVTPIGRILRALKLDELPQLWNVLKGDMSLVGPRPEVPLYVKSYTEEQKKVLTVRPGITDPSTLVYRYEEELLARQANPETYYQEVVLPHKLSLNAQYIRSISLKYDLSLLTKTLSSLFFNRPRYIPSAVNH